MIEEKANAPRRRLKWGSDGKLAEPAVKSSVFLRPQMHKKAKNRAEKTGLSLSEWIARLVVRELGAKREA